MGFWPVVKRVLKDSDLVLLILDARMPELSRNTEAERMIKSYSKQSIYVLNKIDLVGPDRKKELEKEWSGAFLVSGRKNIGIKELRTKLQIMSKKIGKEKIDVGVVGYPNVGKSSIINVLARKGGAKTGSVAGTTRGIQWISGPGFRVLDSPGVIPFEDGSSKLGLIGAKNPDKMKYPEKPADIIIETFLKDNKKESLEKFYKLKLPDDSYEVLLAIGKKRGFLVRGGEVDERKTGIQILRDWQKGKLKL